ncbi:hypothetical protein GA0111570_11467 [Raineyella antarctica]|uniref:Uncharacterized protein n=1 Tax=Raineyella antarctica TaxID=1577474 RepID=A0A1G6I8E6_9ACTN|nr:hypothetical protein [Raineyella antarctica]SDC02295.1 hypothetical protein GA0111570_11467 [Raineyella antarctica]
MLAALDEAGLKKALWTLYWRGSAPVRERIMAAIDPTSAAAQAARTNAPVDAHAIEAEVREFAALARDGAYLAGDRRVSPKERTRWRFTFQRLVKATTQALAGRDVEPAASAMATLIELACELRSVDYFRSEDPVEAARFVVSEAAAVLWAAVRREQGHAAFCELAAGQLVRWESRWGWTRRGEGWVSERETSLAQVIAGMLPAADAWGQFADAYLRALDGVADQRRTTKGRGRSRKERREDLAEWTALLRQRLAHGEYEDRLDALANHLALVGRR